MMNQQQMVATLMQAGHAVILMSHPGNGKTSWLKGLMSHLGRELFTRYPVRENPISSTGVEYPDVQGRRTVHLSAEWLQNLSASGDKAGLLIEEVMSAPPAILACYMQLLAERCHGSDQHMIEIPECLICATANPRESAANASLIPPPVANRLCFVDWKTDAMAAARGFKEGWGSSYEDIPILPDNWKEHIAWSNSVIGAYLEARPQMCEVWPQDRAQRSGAWPSLRTWEHASRTLAAYSSINMLTDASLATAIAGSVGEAAAADLFEQMDMADLPTLQQVAEALKSGELKDCPTRADKVDAVCAMAGNMLAAAMEKSPSEALFRKGVKFFANLKKQVGCADVICGYAHKFIRSCPNPNWAAPDASEFLAYIRARNAS